MEEIIFYQYFERALKFQGMVNSMASSIDYMLKCILEELKTTGITDPLLTVKIGIFENSGNIWESKYNGDKSKLIEDLKQFDTIQTIIKNSLIVMGEKDLTFRINDECYSFQRNKQEDIVHNFSMIMQGLTQIHEALLHP